MKKILAWFVLFAILPISLVTAAPNIIPVHDASGGGSGSADVQYVDAASTVAHPTGTMPIFDNAGTISKVSASVGLPVNCVTGCSSSGGSSSADGAAFTASTTSGTTAMGFYHSTIDTVADGKTAALAMDSKRNAFHVIRDAAGNARGANVNASNQLSVSVDNSPVLGAGTNVIGHVIADTGSTTAVTQGTASNLKAQVVGAGAAGTADAGVLTVQGIASMTKLLVTPDSVALPANQSVNISQINAVTPLMGSGNTGTGSLRVTIATDQPALTNKLLVTPDSVALPANQSVNVNQIGGTAVVADPCQANVKSVAVISMSSATTTRFIAPTSAKKNYICSIVLIASAADNVVLEEGTGGSCGVGTAGMSGDTTTGWALAANGGLTLGNGQGTVGQTAGTNVDTCFKTSSSAQLSGMVMYVQQ